MANTLLYSYILSPRRGFIQWQLALAFEFLQLQRLDSRRLPTALRDLQNTKQTLVTKCQPQAPSGAPLLTQEVLTVIYSRAQIDQVRSWLAGTEMPGEYSCETHVHWPFNTSLRAWGSGGREGHEGTQRRPKAQSCSLLSFQAPVLGRTHCRLPGTFSSPLRRPQRPRSPQGPQPGAQTPVPRRDNGSSGQGRAHEGPRCIRALHAASYPRSVTGTGPHTPSPRPPLTCSAAAQGRVYAAGGAPLRG